jgi:DNA-binding transcriptional LysR family regulator
MGHRWFQHKQLVVNRRSACLNSHVIDVRRLAVLKAVVDTGSVSAAAASLSYTPSAVSQQVTALEKETGMTLLERVGRGVKPTDAAFLLYDHASRVLASIKEAEDALAALRSGQIGRIRLAAFPTAGSSVVPGALAAFQSSMPRVALDVVVAEPDQALAQLRQGEIDVAVVVENSGELAAGGLFHCRHLLSDPFRVVLPRGHRLAAKRVVDIASLVEERWVGVSSCPNYCQEVVGAACRQAGFTPSYALQADEYPTAQGFVAAGLGVAFVPLLALGGAVHPGVAVRRVKGSQPVREVWAVSRHTIASLPAVRAMLDDLEESAQAFLKAQV